MSFPRLRSPLLALAVFAAAGLAACGDDEGTAPTIVRFDLSALTVDAGDRVTISYQVSGADTVEINAQPGGAVLGATAELSGTVTSAALNANTTFVLIARNAAGSTSNSKQVTVRAAPGQVSIESFDANPTMVELGASSVLSWETANATSVGIATADGVVILAPGTQLTGTLEVTPTPPSTVYILTADGNGGPQTDAVQVNVLGAPAITDFTATPSAILVGGSSLLGWAVANAERVEIRDDANNLVTQSTDASGSHPVTPTATTVYTLSASRTGFPDDTETVTVTVNPLQGAVIESFSASPTVLQNIGETSVLAWTVSNATGVEIQAAGTTIFTSGDTMGTLTVTPTQTTDYTLWARSPQGDASDVVTVSVNPSAPAIQSFGASPNPVLLGRQTTISWTTLGASSVRVLRGAVEIFSNASGQVVAGSVQATITSTTPEVFTLEAENSNDVNRSSVTVVGSRAPVIDVFEVNPSVFFTPSVTATVTWSTSGSTEVELFADGVPVVGFPTTSTVGIFSLLVTGTTEIELVARNAVAETREITLVSSVFDKLEPNDTSSTAIALVGDGSGVRGSFGVAGDVDYYSVTVADGAFLTAWTNGGTPNSCLSDTFLHLIGPDGTTELGTDDDDGFDLCSEIAPARDLFARSLAAGTYYLRVRHYSAAQTGDYYLYVQVEVPVCGNGVVEASGAEQCDDGNTSPGDGCNAVCLYEVQPLAVLTGPGANLSATGSIGFIGQRDYYQVDMAVEGFILAETFVPVPGRCDTLDGSPSADTLIRLFDVNLTELGSDDQGGIDGCSRFDEFSGFNLVPAGTYFVSVESFLGNGLINPYVIELETLALGCGNGVIESGEECDDGNAADGDGCTAICGLEGTPETEPNASAAQATPVTVVVGAPALVGGELPSTDVDYFAVTVPEGHSLDASVTVGSLTGCAANADGLELALIAPNGITVLDAVVGPCPRAWPFTARATLEMTAGTYYLRLRRDSGQALPAPYILHVNLIAPGCGNGIFEAVEHCDDGNTASGDGCSATCAAEILQLYTGPAAAETIPGAINPVQGRSFYEIELNAESYIFASSHAPTVGACTSASLRLELFDASFESLGASPSFGPTTCGSIEPPRDAFARQPAGTYYLMVEELGNDQTVSAFELLLEARPVDVCGNAVPGEVGEQCDDGNLTDGDGCSATCQVEANGQIVGPGVSPGVSQVFDLAIGTPGVTQVIRVDMNDAGSLTAFTGVPVIGTCTAAAGETADTRISLFDETFSTQLATNDDFGGTPCSRIQGISLPPGVYFIVVASFFADRVIPDLQVEVQLMPAERGNGIVDFGEQCDDGNLLDGDGCDAICAYETAAVFTGPGPNPTGVSATYSLALPTPGASRVYAIEVTAPSYYSAQTGVATIGSCVAATGETNDTEIELLDAQGVRVAINDQSGGTNCSNLTNVVLQPGTYFLDVHVWNQIGIISQLEVLMSLVPQNACGNGIPELGPGEQCDDGNLVAGDGCDSSCELEASDISVSDAPGLAIPDNNLTGVSTTLVVPSAPACTIGSVYVPMNITHTWRGDLIVDLTSPQGTTVRLHNRTGGSADDLVGVFGLDLSSAEPLSGFTGEDAAGSWTLLVADAVSADTGALNEWGLLISCQ